MSIFSSNSENRHRGKYSIPSSDLCDTFDTNISSSGFLELDAKKGMKKNRAKNSEGDSSQDMFIDENYEDFSFITKEPKGKAKFYKKSAEAELQNDMSNPSASASSINSEADESDYHNAFESHFKKPKHTSESGTPSSHSPSSSNDNLAYTLISKITESKKQKISPLFSSDGFLSTPENETERVKKVLSSLFQTRNDDFIYQEPPYMTNSTPNSLPIYKTSILEPDYVAIECILGEKDVSSLSESKMGHSEKNFGGFSNFSSHDQDMFYQNDRFASVAKLVGNELLQNQTLHEIDLFQQFDLNEVNRFETVYFVKFIGFSYLHSKWLTEKEVLTIPGGDAVLKKWKLVRIKRSLSFSSWIPNLLVLNDFEVQGQFFEPDRILSTNEHQNLVLIKWKGLKYRQSTWENKNSKDFKLKNINFNHNRSKNQVKISKIDQIFNSNPKVNQKDYHIEAKNGDKLRNYQLDAINFLFQGFNNRTGLILADEKGLGKKVTISGFLEKLKLIYGFSGIHLILVQKENLIEWKEILENWTSINVVIYGGSIQERLFQLKYEFFLTDSYSRIEKDSIGADCILTDCDTFLEDFKFFSAIDYRCFAIDQYDKVFTNTKLFKAIHSINYESVTLLTNNLIPISRESKVFYLYQFLNPYLLGLNVTESTYFVNHSLIDLEKALNKIILRRTKDLEAIKAQIPSENHVNILIELCPLQKLLIKSILSENHDILMGLINNKDGTKIKVNENEDFYRIIAQIIKASVHPFLLQNMELLVNNFMKEVSMNSAENQSHSDINSSSGSDSDSDFNLNFNLNGRIRALELIVEEHLGKNQKILVITQIPKMFSILVAFLKAKNVSFVSIEQPNSDAPQELQDTMELVGQFQNGKINLLVSTVNSFFSSLKLENLGAIVLFDPFILDRSWRKIHYIGNNVYIYHLLAKGFEANYYFNPNSSFSYLLRRSLSYVFENFDESMDAFRSFLGLGLAELVEKSAALDDQKPMEFNQQLWNTLFLPNNFKVDRYFSQDLAENQSLPNPKSDAKPEIAKIKELQDKGFPLDLDFKDENNILYLNILKISYYLSKFPEEDRNKLIIKEIFKKIPISEIQDFDILSEYGEIVYVLDKKASKIVRMVGLIERIKRVLVEIQGEVTWPLSSHSWEDPFTQYSILCSVVKDGWKDVFSKWSNSKLKKKGFLKKVEILIDQFENIYSSGPFELVSSSFVPLSPLEWGQAHPMLLNRNFLSSNEIFRLLQVLANFGLLKSWGKIKELSKIRNVSNETISHYTHLLRKLASNLNPDLGKSTENEVFVFPEELEIVKSDLTPSILKTMEIGIRGMKKIRAFHKKTKNEKCFKNIYEKKLIQREGNVPGWWNEECDEKLLTSVLKYGCEINSRWLLDLPFKKNIEMNNLLLIEKAAKKEIEVGLACIPKEIGDAGIKKLFVLGFKLDRLMKCIELSEKSENV